MKLWYLVTLLCFALPLALPYKWVALEGGGVRGISYSGAIRALEDAGMTKAIKGYSGTSAGSQAAALLAAGYTGAELGMVMMELNFEELLVESRPTPRTYGYSIRSIIEDRVKDAQIARILGPNVAAKMPKSFSVRHILRLFDEYGLYSSYLLQSKIDELLQKKTNQTGITFYQLYQRTNVWLRLTATCLTTKRLEWFDHVLTPDVPVALAARGEATPDGTYICLASDSLRTDTTSDSFVLTPLI
jgi:predicted acylesterase/phospholipase RssA